MLGNSTMGNIPPTKAALCQYVKHKSSKPNMSGHNLYYQHMGEAEKDIFIVTLHTVAHNLHNDSGS